MQVYRNIFEIKSTTYRSVIFFFVKKKMLKFDINKIYEIYVVVVGSGVFLFGYYFKNKKKKERKAYIIK